MRARLLSDGQCLRVIDGDTILAMMMCPCCNVQSKQRIRLARIDAPELKGPDRAAAERSKAILAAACQGAALKLGVNRSWPDKYGRVIAEVIVNGVNMSDMMLAYGAAQKWRDPERDEWTRREHPKQ